MIWVEFTLIAWSLYCWTTSLSSPSTLLDHHHHHHHRHCSSNKMRMDLDFVVFFFQSSSIFVCVCIYMDKYWTKKTKLRGFIDWKGFVVGISMTTTASLTLSFHTTWTCHMSGYVFLCWATTGTIIFMYVYICMYMSFTSSNKSHRYRRHHFQSIQISCYHAHLVTYV